MKSWIKSILNEIYKTSIAIGENADVSDITDKLTKDCCNSIDLNSTEAFLVHSAVSVVVEITAIRKSINAYFKNAYTRAILNRTIDVVFEQQQNEIEKMLNTKNPFEEAAEKFSESNEKTLTGLINDIMEKAKAVKDLIGEN